MAHQPVTQRDLTREMARLGIDPSAVSLSGYAEDRYCFEESADGFAVFFGERGRRVDEARFPLEEDALAELLRRVADDPTARLSSRSD